LINSASSNLLAWAAGDPDVVAIKQILSSISGPLVQRLVDAAESGKDVLVVLIGDHHEGGSATRGNSDLADAGVHVIRPLVASSSQQEATLVVRRERGRLRTYVAVLTASGGDTVLSSDARLAHKVGGLFNFLTGRHP